MRYNAALARKAVFLLRRWTRDWGGVLTILFGLWTVGYVLWLSFSGSDSDFKSLVTDAAMPAISLVMTALAWRASRHEALDARVRRAWRIVAVAFSAYFLGNTLWFYYEIVLGQQPAVSWADAFYLSYYPLLLWGLLTFPMSQREGRTRLTFGLDAGTVMLGAGMVIWYYLLRPIALAESSSFLESSVTLAFPVANTVLLFGVVTVLLRRPEVGVRRALAVLTLGIIMDAVGDLGYSYQTLRGAYQGGNWPDKFYMAGFFLMALSGQYQCWRASRRAARPEATPASAARSGEGRPRTDRTGDPEPRRQRARRHAFGRPPYHRDARRGAGRELRARAQVRQGRPLRDARRHGHGHGHGFVHAGAHLRAVLHDEGERQGHWPRTLDRLRHRPAVGRERLGLLGAGARHDV
jgi:hypothetical protein